MTNDEKLAISSIAKPRHYEDDTREIVHLNSVISGLERQIELLYKRCDDYERQRRIIANVIGTRGLMPIRKAHKERRLNDLEADNAN